jgi:hypothetical protein
MSSETTPIIAFCSHCKHQQEVNKKELALVRSVTGATFFKWTCSKCDEQNHIHGNEIPMKYKFIDRNYSDF